MLTQGGMQDPQKNFLETRYLYIPRGVGSGGGGGSWGARDPPFVNHVLSKQPTTGGENLVSNLVLAPCDPPPPP